MCQCGKMMNVRTHTENLTNLTESLKIKFVQEDEMAGLIVVGWTLEAHLFPKRMEISSALSQLVSDVLEKDFRGFILECPNTLSGSAVM